MLNSYVLTTYLYSLNSRAVARSENLGGHIVLGGDNVPPPVEIGLIELSKSGRAQPPAPPLATGLSFQQAITGPPESMRTDPHHVFRIEVGEIIMLPNLIINIAIFQFLNDKRLHECTKHGAKNSEMNWHLLQ